MNKKTFITIDGETTPWRFYDKEEDKICTVKNIHTGKYYEGVIDTISSRGVYKVELVRETTA